MLQPLQKKQEFLHNFYTTIGIHSWFRTNYFQPLQKQAELMHDVEQIVFATFAKKTPELMHGVKQNILRICN